jgi:hypothetical protein
MSSAPVGPYAEAFSASTLNGQSPGGTDATRGAAVHYKWIALSNTTLGVLMATINASITLIALPDIFRGIGVQTPARS